MSSRVLRFLLISLGSRVLMSTLSNKKMETKEKNNGLSFKGVLEVKHNIKGRVRLYAPRVKENIEYSNVLISQLSKVKSISNVEVNSVTGSIVICYNQAELELSLLIGVVIKLLGLEEAVSEKPKSLLSKEMKNVKEAVDVAFYNKTSGILDVKSVVAVLCLVVGARSIRLNPLQLPNGYTLVRWGMNMI
ncbi:MAG: HMA2 domain-containing protein [Clostridium sp.]|uniref:HMA2 domain-containing protein n=1 Tax=Clostridium sp. TaxID=1506 RepID=UPI003EE61770